MAKLDAFHPDRELWDRQPGESKPAFEAFLVYARLPYSRRDDEGRPIRRSLQLAADDLGKSLSLLKGWSSDWRWGERVEAYDHAQRLAEQAAIQEAEREASLRAARRRVELRDEAWGLLQDAIPRVREALAFPLFHAEEEVIEDGPNGPSLIVHRYPLKEVTPASVASLTRALVALGTLATSDGTGALDRVLSQIEPENLTTEQLEALANGADPISVLLSVGAPDPGGEGRTGTEAPA